MDLKELAEMKKQYEEKMLSYGKTAIVNELKAFFAENPEVQRLQWQQYTPYFNDGEECVFSVYSPSAALAVDDSNFLFSWDLPRDSMLRKELDKLEKLTSSSKDLLKVAFGDHCEVTVNRNGEVTVDECNHD